MKEQLKYLFDVLEGNTDYPFLNLALYLKSYQSILDNAGLRWRDQEMYKLGKMVLDDFEKGYDKNNIEHIIFYDHYIMGIDDLLDAKV